jgi:hypothetical protein
VTPNELGQLAAQAKNADWRRDVAEPMASTAAGAVPFLVNPFTIGGAAGAYNAPEDYKLEGALRGAGIGGGTALGALGGGGIGAGIGGGIGGLLGLAAGKSLRPEEAAALASLGGVTGMSLGGGLGAGLGAWGGYGLSKSLLWPKLFAQLNEANDASKLEAYREKLRQRQESPALG